jgi:hypothetical protein
MAAAMLYHRGVAGSPNELLSQKRFTESCELGIQQACKYVDNSVLSSPMSP